MFAGETRKTEEVDHPSRVFLQKNLDDAAVAVQSKFVLGNSFKSVLFRGPVILLQKRRKKGKIA